MTRSKIYKIILVGDGGVGKTAIRRSYFGEKFEKNYMMTLGADFSVKNEYVGEQKYVLQIWDLAGQPRFKEVRSSYYKNISGILLVFDITNQYSYFNISTWLEEIKNNANIDLQSLPVILLGNKIDLKNNSDIELVDTEIIQKYIDDLSNWSNSNIGYFETSALANVNINKAFSHLITYID